MATITLFVAYLIYLVSFQCHAAIGYQSKEVLFFFIKFRDAISSSVFRASESLRAETYHLLFLSILLLLIINSEKQKLRLRVEFIRLEGRSVGSITYFSLTQ